MQSSLKGLVASAIAAAALSVLSAEASAGDTSAYGHAQACTEFGDVKVCLGLGGHKHGGHSKHGHHGYGKSGKHGSYGFGSHGKGWKKSWKKAKKSYTKPYKTGWSKGWKTCGTTVYGGYGGYAAPVGESVFVGGYRGHGLHDGWFLLFEDEAYEASHVFAAAAEARPYSALPRFGLALAQARLGNEHAAVRNMRSGVLMDVAALHQVPDDGRANKKLRKIIKRLRKQAGRGVAYGDAWFTIAAIEVMRGDIVDAHKAIRRAIDHGCGERSTFILRDHIRRLEHPCVYFDD